MMQQRLRRSILLPVLGLGLSVVPTCFAEHSPNIRIARTPRIAESKYGPGIESLIPSDESNSLPTSTNFDIGPPDQSRISNAAKREDREPVRPDATGSRNKVDRSRFVITPSEPRETKPQPPLRIPRVHPSVVRRSSLFLDDAVALAGRGAPFSARAQLIKGLRLISQSLDAESGTQYFSTSLANGLRTLDEATDFVPLRTELESNLNLDQIVAAHRTKLLQPGHRPTALAALQMYHAHAEEQLAAACGHEPIASQILMGLAKLQPLLVSQNADVTSLALPRAMSLYQAALIVNPQNYLAANELGVLFARYGQLRDARDILAHCVEMDPTKAVGWKNLASIHRQLGEHELASAATAEFRLVSSGSNGIRNSRGPAVQWVDPDTYSQREI